MPITRKLFEELGRHHWCFERPQMLSRIVQYCVSIRRWIFAQGHRRFKNLCEKCFSTWNSDAFKDQGKVTHILIRSISFVIILLFDFSRIAFNLDLATPPKKRGLRFQTATTEINLTLLTCLLTRKRIPLTPKHASFAMELSSCSRYWQEYWNKCDHTSPRSSLTNGSIECGKANIL